ncbi:CGNR zinc finger protein [Kribbella voronezhensis]|uniref:CGNR zinc finger protein n=1 Tax=Kribbella voronezhensis TaxID=2512212 RepID=A0A4R7TH14_9ACTN|nr:ABATE domain-containing protein [Kribbella voronezhensis]TDU91534.1 CGNR zinc finger protein [Kribbella voronezhensis]
MTSLAFELAATIRHDGQGGVADLLGTDRGLAEWVDGIGPLASGVLGRPFDPSALTVDDDLRQALFAVRRAVRSLFARAVSPAPPSRADADRLLEPAVALAVLNKAADKLGTSHLDWPADGLPATTWSVRSSDPTALLVGAVGRSGIDFLTSPDRARLRACPAARCVKYFLQDDPRQTWCSPSCGNRERVNRHYQRKHSTTAH